MVAASLPDLCARARLRRCLPERHSCAPPCAVLTTGPTPAAAVTVCFDNAEQGKLVADNEIVPVSAAASSQKGAKEGKLVEADRVPQPKGFFYQMTMQSAEGETKVVRVPPPGPRRIPSFIPGAIAITRAVRGRSARSAGSTAPATVSAPILQGERRVATARALRSVELPGLSQLLVSRFRSSRSRTGGVTSGLAACASCGQRGGCSGPMSRMSLPNAPSVIVRAMYWARQE